VFGTLRVAVQASAHRPVAAAVVAFVVAAVTTAVIAGIFTSIAEAPTHQFDKHGLSE